MKKAHKTKRCDIAVRRTSTPAAPADRLLADVRELIEARGGKPPRRSTPG